MKAKFFARVIVLFCLFASVIPISTSAGTPAPMVREAKADLNMSANPVAATHSKANVFFVTDNHNQQYFI